MGSALGEAHTTAGSLHPQATTPVHHATLWDRAGKRPDRQCQPCARGIYAGDVQSARSGFRIRRLDHVHIRVPDRAEAARWYAENLGFEPVDAAGG